MHRPHSEVRLERGIHIVEDRYKSGLLEIGFYATSQRSAAICIVERQPGTVKWHLFGRSGSRPIKSGRSKAEILRLALDYAVENRTTPANRGTLETVE